MAIVCLSGVNLMAWTEKLWDFQVVADKVNLYCLFHRLYGGQDK